MSTDDEEARLLRALRAPGSDAELSEEERYRAMFRATHSPAAPVRTVRSRAPRRLLGGMAAAAVLAVGTGGVAAAYSGNLPSPIQTLAHHVIGAPEASPPAPSSGSPVPSARTPRSPAGPTADASSSPSDRPTHQPLQRPARPVPSSGASASATVPESAKPSGSPRDSASSKPTGTPAPVLTGVALVGTSHRADVGARVRFSGQLTYADTPNSRQRVVLQQFVGHHWTPVGHGRADGNGSIALNAPPLQRTGIFRLRAGHGSGAVRSVPWRVAMHPLVTADVSATKKKATIDVTASGAFGGDILTLTTRRDGRQLIVGQTRLDPSGSASFVLAPDQRRTSYILVLDPTKRHTSARAGAVVRLERGAGG